MARDSSSSRNARDRILDAALDLVADEGVGAVTNRALASRAGISLGTLTYHFASQNEILHEALTRFVEGEAARLEAISARAAEAEDPAAALAAIQKILSGKSGQRLAKLELYVVAARNGELRAAAKRCFDAYDAIVARGLESVGVEPDETIVRATVAMIDGLQLRRLALGEKGELAIADAVGLLLSGKRSNG